MNSDVNSSAKSHAKGNPLQKIVQKFFKFVHALFQNFEWASLLILLFLPLEAFVRDIWYEGIQGAAGALFFAFGMIFRIWARGYEKNGRFVLDGPYRFVQNPDELGSLLIYIGGYLMLGVIWSWTFAFALLALAYFACVSSSYEERLRKKVGASFPRYRQRVKRWIPSFYPAVNRSHSHFQWKKAFKKEISTWLWLAGFLTVTILRRWFFHRS